MPDNDLDRRLAVVEQTWVGRPRDNSSVTTPNPNDVRATHVDNINWKALYKVLESEVETVIGYPKGPSYVKEWGQRVMDRLKQHLPR